MTTVTLGVWASSATNPLLWAWGDNYAFGNGGQLGDGTNVNKSSPVQIGALADWASISARRRSFAVKTDGTLWAWGRNSEGYIGDGTTVTRSSPVQIGALTDWASVEAGDYHSLAVKTNGTLWAWGDGFHGQLGLGDINDRNSPVQIGSLTDWSSVSGGQEHSIAVKTNGTLWAWGRTYPNGQVGDGTNIDKSSPVQIGALTDWDNVNAGYTHSLAVKTNGTLWAWGDNSPNGNLGDGTVIDRSSPVQIGALTDWDNVSGGPYHSLAIKTDGTLWAWGLNANGGLGDGTTVNKSSPVQVGALTDWDNVAAGNYFSLATKTDGTLWSWGEGSIGKLGDGTTVNKSSPVQVGALTIWASISAGQNHSLALKKS